MNFLKVWLGVIAFMVVGVAVLIGLDWLLSRYEWAVYAFLLLILSLAMAGAFHAIIYGKEEE